MALLHSAHPVLHACKSETSTDCDFAPVTITYPYNAHSPSFNRRIGQATIADAEACTGGCPAVFEPPFSGSDADGDVLEYSIIPFTEHSNLFEILDPSTLAISYKGNGVSQNEIVTLLVQVRLFISILCVLNMSLLRQRRKGYWMMPGVWLLW